MEETLWDFPIGGLDHILCDIHSCAVAIISGSILKQYTGMSESMAWAICFCCQPAPFAIPGETLGDC